MKQETGCDGVMIGRGALGNPWIFQSILKNHNHELKTNIDIAEIIRISKRHFYMLESYYNPRICINHTKKHLSWYYRGFDGASHWRKRFMHAEEIVEIKSLIKEMEEYFVLEYN